MIIVAVTASLTAFKPKFTTSVNVNREAGKQNYQINIIQKIEDKDYQELAFYLNKIQNTIQTTIIASQRVLKL